MLLATLCPVIFPAWRQRDRSGVPTGQGCGFNRLRLVFSGACPVFSSLRLRGLLADDRGGDSFLAALLLLGDAGLAGEFVTLGAGGGFGCEVGGRAQVTLFEGVASGERDEALPRWREGLRE
ncbi:hypothetical protein ACFV8T_33165 [Streptomyces sp. NPDC059832]|uniref:hypothetical protein n=1 Tax=unclassified Streptomyces TaxID=2593676 RepID=UPI0036497224